VPRWVPAPADGRLPVPPPLFVGSRLVVLGGRPKRAQRGDLCTLCPSGLKKCTRGLGRPLRLWPVLPLDGLCAAVGTIVVNEREKREEKRRKGTRGGVFSCFRSVCLFGLIKVQGLGWFWMVLGFGFLGLRVGSSQVR